MHRRLARSACIALIALALASPAFGVEALLVQGVDTAAFPRVAFTVLVSPDVAPRPGDVPEVTVIENGSGVADVTVTSLERERSAIDVVLLMDASGSMKGRPLEHARVAARRFIESMRRDDRIAVVAFSSEPVILLEFTSDRDALFTAIDGIEATGETALYDGLVQAAGLASASAAPERYIVALSDGGDTLSLNPPDNAATAVIGASTPVYAVALESPEYNPATLETIARVSGGRMTTVADSTALEGIYASIAEEMQLRYRVECTSARPNTPELEYRVTAGSGETAVTTQVTVRNPAFGAAAETAAPLTPGRPNALALILALASTFGAVALFAVSAQLIFRRDKAALEQLRYYDQLRHAGMPEGRRPDEGSVRGGLLSALGTVAERRGFTGLVQRWLESAGLALRANEYIFFHVLGTIIVALVTQILSGGLVLAIGLSVALAAVTPIVFLKLKASKRVRDLEEQLPDILDLIAGSLRSGWGIQQAIDLVVDEVGNPASSEFRRTQAEARLGLPLEEALSRMAERVDSADLRWTVSAISIQREVGGNLAEVLNTVAHTIRERAELRRQVSALTAEGRYSLVVLTVLPFFVFFALFAVNPEYMLVALQTPAGQGAFVLGGVLLLIGVYWLNRVMRIEV